MQFVTKEQWGSSNPNYPNPQSHPIGATLGITAHWEGPGIGDFPHSLCARKVRAIERFHIGQRGWAGIAYNALVCPHGYVFEGRGVWTKSAANGGTQVNDDWYAVCDLSGKGDAFTAAAKTGFRDAFNWLASKGGAGPRRNGHRDHKATECPGDAIYRWVHNTDFDAPPPTSEEDEMPTVKQIVDGLPGTRIRVYGMGDKATRQIRVVLAQTHFRADGARTASRRALSEVGQLAKVVGDGGLSPETRKQLADQIAARTAAEVERLDAEAVAEELEITTKES